MQSMETIRLIATIVLFIAFVFIVAEFLTDEVEFFSPAAAILMIAGLILLFAAEPQDWFGLTDSAFTIFQGGAIFIGVASVGLSGVLFYKVRQVKNLPPESSTYVGKEAKVLTPISKETRGYVQFEGAKWKAYTVGSDSFDKDDVVMISGMDGINFIVRKSK
jgi:membrane-bound ClpP family serine protease